MTRDVPEWKLYTQHREKPPRWEQAGTLPEIQKHKAERLPGALEPVVRRLRQLGRIWGQIGAKYTEN